MRVTYHLAALVTIGLTSPARADDYRVEVTTANLTSAAVFTVGVKVFDLDCTPCFATAAVGLAGMALAAPVIHALEDNYGRMGISLGARVVLPVITVTAGTSFGLSKRHVYWGLMTGFLAATAIDLAIAADDDPPEKRLLSFGGRF